MVGEGGQREFVSVTPESKMSAQEKGGGDTYVYISAVDAESVVNLFKKNSGIITRVVEDDLRGYGTLAKKIKGL
jgi:hypothetical protein